MALDSVRPQAPAVVVTGAHRSGTTVLGDFISRSPGTWTVWEPFNQHWGLACVKTPYPFLSEPASPPVVALRRYLESGRGDWSVKAGRGGPIVDGGRRVVRRVRRQVLWQRNRDATAIIKDPFALLALPALQDSITSAPAVVSIRHPCAWVLSLRRVSWPAGSELNALIAQEEMYESRLADVLPRRDWRNADDVESGARAWACLYRLFLDETASRPGAGAIVVPLETFGNDPVGSMRQIYNLLRLREPENIDDLAAKYTGPENPVAPGGRTIHMLRRDSRTLSNAWKVQMPRQDAERVRALTEETFRRIYPDWEGVPQDLSLVPSPIP